MTDQARGAGHTKGPWSFDFGTIGGPSIKSASGVVADVRTYGVRTGGPLDPVCEANARLIAAAPDLLTALEALVPADMLEHPHDFGPDWHAARRAIARAKGEA